MVLSRAGSVCCPLGKGYCSKLKTIMVSWLSFFPGASSAVFPGRD